MKISKLILAGSSSVALALGACASSSPQPAVQPAKQPAPQPVQQPVAPPAPAQSAVDANLQLPEWVLVVPPDADGKKFFAGIAIPASTLQSAITSAEDDAARKAVAASMIMSQVCVCRKLDYVTSLCMAQA